MSAHFNSDRASRRVANLSINRNSRYSVSRNRVRPLPSPFIIVSGNRINDDIKKQIQLMLEQDGRIGEHIKPKPIHNTKKQPEIREAIGITKSEMQFIAKLIIINTSKKSKPSKLSNKRTHKKNISTINNVSTITGRDILKAMSSIDVQTVDESKTKYFDNAIQFLEGILNEKSNFNTEPFNIKLRLLLDNTNPVSMEEMEQVFRELKIGSTA